MAIQMVYTPGYRKKGHFYNTWRRTQGLDRQTKIRGVELQLAISMTSFFFSFFSLVPLGCCGSWLLVLSYLPTIFGTALSVSLIQYSRPLSYVGLIIVLSFAGISAFKLRSELRERQHNRSLQHNMDKIN